VPEQTPAQPAKGVVTVVWRSGGVRATAAAAAAAAQVSPFGAPGADIWPGFVVPPWWAIFPPSMEVRPPSARPPSSLARPPPARSPPLETTRSDRSTGVR
jgi:hypothetical protein